MYSTEEYYIGIKHPLYSYCDNICKKENNFQNKVLFIIRQLFTGLNKPENKRTDNEKEVISGIEEYSKSNNKKMIKPNSIPSSFYLNGYFPYSKDVDYYAEGYPAQTAQQAVEQVVENMTSFFEANKDFKVNPTKYKGKPRIPKYHKRGGYSTATITNQDANIKIKDKKAYLKLPKTKLKLQVRLYPEERSLKEVKISPASYGFIIHPVYEDTKEVPETRELNKAIVLDLGVRNFVTIVNNIGKESILFKGGYLKSINQYTAKNLARIQSKETKGSTDKFVMNDEANILLLNRKFKINDYLHKVAKFIVTWCLKYGIDTIIIGSNRFWKQNCNMSKKENQKFCQMPHAKFKQILKYLCNMYGITYIEREESYTSKASFMDNDYIPTYGIDDTNVKFSGKRSPTSYKGHKRPNNSGFSGWYVSKEGIWINSDLNGASNIGRKEKSDLFTKEGSFMPKFNDVLVIKHPDKIMDINPNRCSTKITSKSKHRRLIIKSKKCNPNRIELCG